MGLLEEIKAILRSLIMSSQDIMTIEKLNNEYRKAEGEDIPFQKFGFKNLESFLGSISDTVIVCGVGYRAKVTHVPNDKSVHIFEMISHQKRPTRRRIQQNVKHINLRSNQYRNTFSPANFHSKHYYANDDRVNMDIPPYRNAQRDHCNTKCSGKYLFSEKELSNSKQFKHSIGQVASKQIKYFANNNCESKFSKSHSKTVNFNIPLRSEETEKPATQLNKNSKKEKTETLSLNFKNIDENTCEEIKTVKQYKNKVPLVNVFLEYNEIERNYDDIDEAVPEFAANNLVFQCDFPDDTVTFGTKFENYPFPNEITTGSILELYISEIHSPFKFWFQLQKDTKNIQKLMTRINNFFNSFGETEYCIPLVCIIPGQLCGALYNNEWHRGTILSTVINNFAKILFVDFGTVCNVHVNHIKFLPKAFIQLPRQAMRGSLSHVKPRGLHWNHNATEYLVAMVADKMLFGKVSEINMENESVHFVICDSNGPNVIQINEHLIIKGYAHIDVQWMEHKIRKIGKREHHVREDYPTFAMLEEGDYPTLYELMDLYLLGIDYENITDRIMYHPGRLNTITNISDSIRNLPFHLLTTNPFRGEILLSLTL